METNTASGGVQPTGDSTALLAEFGRWLGRERGLSPVSVQCYSKQSKARVGQATRTRRLGRPGPRAHGRLTRHAGDPGRRSWRLQPRATTLPIHHTRIQPQVGGSTDSAPFFRVAAGRVRTLDRLPCARGSREPGPGARREWRSSAGAATALSSCQRGPRAARQGRKRDPVPTGGGCISARDEHYARPACATRGGVSPKCRREVAPAQKIE
jgi:hypothetical protein